jgi:CheY-like chemotaxis protein
VNILLTSPGFGNLPSPVTHVAGLRPEKATGRILVVDDERNIRLLVSTILKVQQFEIVEANHGREALEQLAIHNDITLIISDVRMPEYDGLRLTETVKQAYPHIPMLIISAFREESPEAFKRGADDFLFKPFSRDQLLNAVARLIKRDD